MKQKSEEHFKIWMQQVDAHLEKMGGVTSDDLPDYCYRDAFNQGRTSLATARAAYRRAYQDY